MRFIFSACLLAVLLAGGFVLTLGRMLSALVLPAPEKALRA